MTSTPMAERPTRTVEDRLRETITTATAAGWEDVVRQARELLDVLEKMRAAEEERTG